MIEKIKKFFKRLKLRNKQRKINAKYESEGLSDEVLQLQVMLNTERYELDIEDETERIYGKYVQ